MTVALEGRYRVTFNIAGKSDFVNDEGFDSFTIIEDAGGRLPTFELSFYTMDPSILPLLNEGASFNVLMQDGTSQQLQTDLKIKTKHFDRQGAARWLVYLAGGYNAPKYDSERIRITDKVSSVDAIRETVGEYMKLDLDVGSSQDQQNWVQHGITDRRFVFECFKHCNLPGSFPAIGITSDGVFRMRDARRIVTSRAITVGVGGEYTCAPELRADGGSALYNTIGSAGLLQIEHELGKSQGYTPPKRTEPVRNLFTSGQLNRSADSQPRTLSPASWSSGNVNPNFLEAYRRNLASTLCYSQHLISVIIDDHLTRIKVLDLVMYRDTDARGSAIEGNSGNYITTKVARTLKDKHLSTTLILSREGMNQQQGDLR